MSNEPLMWRYSEREVVLRRGWFGRAITKRAVVVEVYDPEAYVHRPRSHSRGVWRLAAPLEIAYLAPENRR